LCALLSLLSEAMKTALGTDNVLIMPLQCAESMEQVSNDLTLGPLLAALSRALDLTEGQVMGHSVHACLIALQIADVVQLSIEEKHDLHLAMLLKDAGCSSNATRMFEIFGGDEIAAKQEAKFCNWCSMLEGFRYVLNHTAPQLLFTERLKKLTQITCTPAKLMDRLTLIRCERGAEIVRALGLGERVSEIVYNLDEHWNGFGFPHGKKRQAIPLLARIACLAQTVAVFHTHFGKEKALSIARNRSKTWFDPELVKALFSFADDEIFWKNLSSRAREALEERTIETALNTKVSQSDLDGICTAFANVVDAKSPFTANHSRRVAEYARQMGANLGMPILQQTELYHAGLLHDLGKLGVSSLILEKPGRLTEDEWEVIRRHPEGTGKVLAGVPALRRIREIAVTHHEKLDGSGYGKGLRAEQLDTSQRILAVADIWDALTADRPYRAGMSPEDAMTILRKEERVTLDADCIAAINGTVQIFQVAA
jgi:HD-GYP domain-containing protein (c-di-GMP phosphodiesterase class II)